MNKQDIKKMGEAWSSVVNPVTEEEILEEGTMCESCGKTHEGKCNPADVETYKKKQEDASNDEEDDGEGLDKVDPKAAKKKFKDRKDKDIDNDGDVDDSDEFLHKRRKAVGKAMKKDKPAGNSGEKKSEISKIGEETEIFEAMTSSNWHKQNTWQKFRAQFMKAMKGKPKNDGYYAVIEIIDATTGELKNKEMSDELKNMSPAVKRKQIRGLKAKVMKALDRSQAAAMVREDIELSESTTKLLDMLESAAKAQKANATEPEDIMDKESEKSKQFAMAHSKSDKKIEDNYEDGVKKTTEAGKATKAKSGKRPQDNAAGDTNVVKSTEAPVKGGAMEAYVSQIRKDTEKGSI